MKDKKIQIKRRIKMTLAVSSVLVMFVFSGCNDENVEQNSADIKESRILHGRDKNVTFMKEDEIPADTREIELIGCKKKKGRYYIECYLYDDNWHPTADDVVRFPLADDFHGDFITWMSDECGTYDVDPPIRETFDSARDFFDHSRFIGKSFNTYLEEYEFNEDDELVWATDDFEPEEPVPAECVEEDFIGSWKYQLEYDICGCEYNPGDYESMDIYEDHTYVLYWEEQEIMETGSWEFHDNTLFLYEDETGFNTESFYFNEYGMLSDSCERYLNPKE